MANSTASDATTADKRQQPRGVEGVAGGLVGTHHVPHAVAGTEGDDERLGPGDRSVPVASHPRREGCQRNQDQQPERGASAESGTIAAIATRMTCGWARREEGRGGA